MLRGRRRADSGLRSLREVLRESLRSAPTGWLLLPSGDLWSPDTLGAIRDIDEDELAAHDSDVVVVGGHELEPIVDGPTLHDICQGAQRLQRRPTDETLFEAFRYYSNFDAFLPALGAPDPPPIEEITARLDREFWELLGEERADKPCRREGCTRGSVEMSVLCRVHHFESIKKKPCPFDGQY
jgi:hypothetical protein